ncbi:MAG: YihY/virulence factor BrkB family protein [Solobacterium sp.]|nr:YihY/virulence factor BrkB family protein [Solobacterium sp.]
MKTNRFVKLLLKTINLFTQQKMDVYAGFAALCILMALVPLLMLILAVVNMLPGYSAADFSAYVTGLFPGIPAVQDMLKSIIMNLSEQSGGVVISLSALTSLWAASNGVSAIQTALDNLSGIRQSFVKGKKSALLFTVIYVLLIPSLLIFQVLRSSIESVLEPVLAMLKLQSLASTIYGILAFSGILSLIVMALVIIMTYTYLPNGKRTLKSQLPGAVLATVAAAVFTGVFGYCMTRFWKASSVYGSLAAIFLTAMWLQFILQILFFGAALNQAIHETDSE